VGTNSQQKKQVKLKKNLKEVQVIILYVFKSLCNVKFLMIHLLTIVSCGPDDIFENLDDISPYAISCQIFDDHVIDRV